MIRQFCKTLYYYFGDLDLVQDFLFNNYLLTFLEKPQMREYKLTKNVRENFRKIKKMVEQAGKAAFLEDFLHLDQEKKPRNALIEKKNFSF